MAGAGSFSAIFASRNAEHTNAAAARPRVASGDEVSGSASATADEDGEPAVQEITEEVFDKFLPGWRSRQHKHLTFRGKAFDLSSLDGLVRTKVNLMHLESLDVSENSLRDLNCIRGTYGFTALRVLKARHNKVSLMRVTLPMLREMDLSYNRLKELPAMAGMASLQVLLLAHNSIQGTWDTLKNLRDLRKLDISDNLFDLKPKDLSRAIAVLEDLPMLQSLRVKGNPFTSLLPEYQAFFLKRLKNLVKLDDISDISDARDAAKVITPELGAFNTIIYERGKVFRPTQAQAKDGEANVPSLQELARPVTEAVQDTGDPANTHKTIKELVRLCDKIYTTHPGKLKSMFRDIASSAGEVARDQEVEAMLQAFLGNFQVLLDRVGDNESQRVMLLRCLAKLGVVWLHGFGEQCIGLLGWLLHMSDRAEDEILDIVREVVIEPLNSRSIQDPQMLVIVRGLVRLDTPKLAEALKPVAGWLAKMYCCLGASPQKDITWLLSVATEDRDNTEHALKFAGKGEVGQEDTLPDYVILALENRQLSTNESLREQYMGHLKIAENTAVGGGRWVVEIYEGRLVHRELVKALKTFFGDSPIEGSTYSRTNPNRKTIDVLHIKILDLRTCACLLSTITALISQSPDMLQDLVDARSRAGVPVLEYYMIAPRAPAVDPLLLAASLKGIQVILEKYSAENVTARRELLMCVIKDLDDMRPMLEYISEDSRQYLKLWQLAEKHVAERRESSSAAASAQTAPRFAALHNPLVFTAMKAIVNLIAYFTAEGKNDDQCARVASVMNDLNREQLLFKLLEVPDNGVKDAVMNCIGLVEIEQLSADEVGCLVRILGNVKHISTETPLLVQVIQQLSRFADDPTAQGAGGAGQALHTQHGERAIRTVSRYLSMNLKVRTYGNAEAEENKVRLTKECVGFLQRTSKWHDVRDTIMRSAVSNTDLVEALGHEDRESRVADPCSLAECTWTGRSIETLLQCFAGKERVQARGKVAYRVVARIADVLEGRSDLWRGELRAYRGCLEMAEKECNMWDEGRMKLNLNKLDDSEAQDRTLQQDIFSKFNGLDRTIQFFTGLFADESCITTVRMKEQSEIESAKTFLESAKETKTADLRTFAEESDEDKYEQDENLLVQYAGGDFPPRESVNIGQSCERIQKPFGSAISIAFTVYWESLGLHATIIDWGNGSPQNNIIIQSEGTSTNLVFTIYLRDDGTKASLTVPYSIRVQEKHQYLFTVSASGEMIAWCDGSVVAQRADGFAPKVCRRKYCYVGRYSWTSEDVFKGRISGLKAWHGVKNWEDLQHSYLHDEKLDIKPLMRTLQTVDQRERRPPKPDLQIGAAMGTLASLELTICDNFFDDTVDGRVNVAYPIAAIMRCCFALVKLPALDSIRKSIIAGLQNHLLVSRLLSLVQLCGPFDCCVAAKFLRLMSYGLTLPEGQMTEEVERIIVYHLLTNFYAGICKTAVVAVRQKEDQLLATRGLMLSTEIARLTTVIIQSVPFCTVSPEKKVQKDFVEACLERLIPLRVLEAVIKMVLHDPKAEQSESAGDPSSVGTANAPKKKVKDLNQQSQISDLSRVMIALLLDKCPKLQYEIFTVFSTHMIEGTEAVRLSFLTSLLQQMKQAAAKAQLQEAMEQQQAAEEAEGAALLAQQEGSERAVLYVRAEVIWCGRRISPVNTSHPTPFLAALATTKNVHIVDMSAGGYPTDPTMALSLVHLDMTRIVKCRAAQVLFIGYMKRHPTTHEVIGEDIMAVVCHREGDRNELLGTLHALSQPKFGDARHRVPLQGDRLTKGALNNKVTEPILLTCIVDDDEPTRESPCPRMYVLSDTQLYTLEVRFGNWIPTRDEDAGLSSSEEEDLDSADDDAAAISGAGKQAQLEAASSGLGERKQKHGKRQEAQSTLGDSAGAEAGAHVDEKRAQELTKLRRDARSAAVARNAQTGELLGEVAPARALLGLDKVAFTPDQRPKMLLVFSSEHIEVTFFDYGSREIWKRTLLGLLQRVDTGAKWVQKFQSWKPL